MIKKTLSKLALSLTLVLSMIGCGPEMPVSGSDGGVAEITTTPPRVVSLGNYEEFFIPAAFTEKVTRNGCPMQYVGQFRIRQESTSMAGIGMECTVIADTRRLNAQPVNYRNQCQYMPEGIRLQAKISQYCPSLQPDGTAWRSQIEGLGDPIQIVLIP